MQLSSFHRNDIIQKLSGEQFDLLIIGGGITGAGIALDAASRGLKTALIDKNDFAFGTSSRSTKLIHGGLRYLKQLEFALVKEVGSERAIVHRLAPHLVVAEKMLLPLKEGRGFGSLLTSFGLSLYDWLAGVKSEDQRRMLTRSQTLQCEPLLNPEGVKGGGLYAEYRTDDARLTIEIMKTAANHGACVLNYVEAEEFIYEKSVLNGVVAHDRIYDQVFSVHAHRIVNATGPWVDSLRTLDKSKEGKELHLTKGVHVVVAREKFPVRQSVYFDVPDGRMIFAIPRGRTTYIGTTDTDYKGDPDHVVTTPEDADYLLSAVKDSFPSVDLQRSDIESSWAGLRPLIHEKGKSASELSRKDVIFISPSGLVSIAGGKLTGYRKMAERVVDLVIRRKSEAGKYGACTTDNIPLAGGPFSDRSEVKAFLQSISERLDPFGISPYADYLVHNYGRQTEAIINHFELLNDEDPDIRLGRAELWFTVQFEMVVSPLDFLVRRTGILYFHMDRLPKLKEPLLADFKEYFAWPERKSNEAREELEQAIREAQLKV